MPLWYFEACSPLGRWMPATSMVHPRIERHAGTDRLGGGTGPKVRGLVQVADDHARLTLDQLREVYGKEGRFQATRPRSDGDLPLEATP